MKHNYKAIVFDYGGVLEFFEGPGPLVIAAKIMGVPEDKLKERYFKYNHLSNTENMPWNDMFKIVMESFETPEETQERVFDEIKKDIDTPLLNTQLISALPSLTEQGFRLSIFSNYTSILREKLHESGLVKFFDEIVISGEIGFQKPDKIAFESLFKILDVSPSEVIFIDDTPKSLEQAEEIGYTPILFSDNETLKTDLGTFGISIELT